MEVFIQTYNIEDAKNIFRINGFILDDDHYKNTQTKMACHDADGFYYEVSLSSLLNNKKPYKFHKTNRFTTKNIQLILDRETDGVKLLSDKYINSRTKLRFVCSCGNNFETDMLQFVSDKKRYCNYCSKSKRYDSNDYTEQIRLKCNSNNCTLLTNNINRTNQRFYFIYNKHLENGIQSSNYNNFMNNKYGCQYCAKEYKGINHRVTKDEIVELLESKNFRYIRHDYPNAGSGNASKVKIYYICNNHVNKGIQSIQLYNLKTIKKGCPYCCGRGRSEEDLQREIDSLNSNVDIIEYRKYSDLTVKCRKCGNEWDTTGVNLIEGHRCPKCCKSTYEKNVEAVLINNGIKYIPQYKIDDCRDKLPLPFDFYLPDYNTLIEVDGEGHYRKVNFRGMSDDDAERSFKIIKAHDEIKNNYCKENKIQLIRIPYFVIKDKSIDLSFYILSKINKSQ